MFIIANFLEAVATIISIILSVYMWIIIGRAIISWFNVDPYNPIASILYQVTEPVLARVRRVVPAFGGGIDFSPMILILVIIFLQKFLVTTLHQIARSLG